MCCDKIDMVGVRVSMRVACLGDELDSSAIKQPPIGRCRRIHLPPTRYMFDAISSVKFSTIRDDREKTVFDDDRRGRGSFFTRGSDATDVAWHFFADLSSQVE